MSSKGKKQKVTVSLHGLSECAVICGVDGEEICHHGAGEESIIEVHSLTPIDRYINSVRVMQNETQAKVTGNIEFP